MNKEPEVIPGEQKPQRSTYISKISEDPHILGFSSFAGTPQDILNALINGNSIIQIEFCEKKVAKEQEMEYEKVMAILFVTLLTKKEIKVCFSTEQNDNPDRHRSSEKRNQLSIKLHPISFNPICSSFIEETLMHQKKFDRDYCFGEIYFKAVLEKFEKKPTKALLKEFTCIELFVGQFFRHYNALIGKKTTAQRITHLQYFELSNEQIYKVYEDELQFKEAKEIINNTLNEETATFLFNNSASEMVFRVEQLDKVLKLMNKKIIEIESNASLSEQAEVNEKNQDKRYQFKQLTRMAIYFKGETMPFELLCAWMERSPHLMVLQLELDQNVTIPNIDPLIETITTHNQWIQIFQLRKAALARISLQQIKCLYTKCPYLIELNYLKAQSKINIENNANVIPESEQEVAQLKIQNQKEEKEILLYRRAINLRHIAIFNNSNILRCLRVKKYSIIESLEIVDCIKQVIV